MAGSRISVIIDVATTQANRAIGDFRKQINDADGAVGKFKAGSSAAFGAIKANAGEFAVAAGAALVAFGAKSVAAFNDVAIESGRMSEALGIPVEDMSRLIDVAGELGIESSSLEQVLGRMNQTAGKSPAAFEAIGAEIVKTESGATDVNATFLSTVDALNRIEDPAKRAAAAQQIFGRSWRDSAELIGLSSKQITDAMAEVSDAEVINDDEVKKARDYRDAMVKLKESIGNLQLVIGGYLVPVLTDAAETLMTFKSAAEDVSNFIPGPLKTSLGLLADQVERSMQPWKYYTDVKGILTDTTDTVGTLGKTITEFESSSSDTAQAYVEHAKGMQRAAEETAEANEEATARIERAWDSLNEELSDRSAYLDIQDALDDVEAAYLTAMDTAGKSLQQQEADLRNVERAVIDVRGKVNEYAQEIAGLPPEYATDIQALIDEGAFAEVERRLATLEKIRIARITPETYIPGGGRTTTSGSRFHSGGVVGVGNFASDEVPAVLQKGEMVLTEGQQAAVAGALGGGGPNITINVTAGIGADEAAIGKQVARALDAYYRSGGRRL